MNLDALFKLIPQICVYLNDFEISVCVYLIVNLPVINVIVTELCNIRQIHHKTREVFSKHKIVLYYQAIYVY